MSATITHKGSTVTTVSNTTKTLTTKGTWLEDDIVIEDSTPTLGTKSISSNGTYTASSDSLGGYSQVSVSVPNTYAAGDEGKVVDNGALVSQSTATYSSNDTYDTTKIKTVTVAVPSSSPNLQAKTNISPSTSSQTIQADTGYDGLSSVQINAMPTQTLPTSASSSGSGTTKATISRSTSDQYINIPTGYNASAANYKVSAVANGTAGTPTASKGTVSNHSVSVTPSVTNTTGYITGSTKTGTAVSVSASELVSGSETKTANGTYDVTNLAELVVNVSGSSKNVQVAQSTSRVSSTSMTGISNFSISVAETGTYDVYYSAFRSSTSGTWSTQLYVAGSAYGSSQTSWSNHIQNVHLTNVSLTKNQTVQVYGISRGSNYYLYGGTLTIIQN